jgi:hypothetical protein
MKDFTRPEGLYLKFSEPVVEPHTPVVIERVNGDCSVSRFIIARDEARKLIGQLESFLGAGNGEAPQVGAKEGK